MNTKKKITELMDEHDLELTDLMDYLKIDKKMVKKAAKKKESEKEYSKIRLTPISFSKVGIFFQKGLLKLKSKTAEIRAEHKERKLQSLTDRIAEGAITKRQLAKIAFKVAQLEEKIQTLDYQSRIEGKVLKRALKLKSEMKDQLVQGSKNLYYFEENPFVNDEKREENVPLEAQLDEVFSSSVPEKQETLSMADQLEADLAKEPLPVDEVQLEEEQKPLSMEEQLEQNLQETDQEDKTVESILPKELEHDRMPIDPEAYQHAYDTQKKRVAEENHQLDNYLLNGGSSTYHLKHDEIIQDRPTLTQDKEQLEQALSSLNSSSSNDYIRREYQRDLDRVNELLRNSSSVSSTSTSFVDSSLIDLMKAAEEEERRAQELADQARLAKEEALQAAREKDEKQRMALETDERYRQLLQEAKATIEARSQRARERAEQERLELARNRELVDGIRKDSQEIAAKVAQRQNDISQLESVLGQYKGDNVSRSSMK